MPGPGGPPVGLEREATVQNALFKQYWRNNSGESSQWLLLLGRYRRDSRIVEQRITCARKGKWPFEQQTSVREFPDEEQYRRNDLRVAVPHPKGSNHWR